jgi:hypothetical protein
MGFFSCDSTTSSNFLEFHTTYYGENDDRTWSKIFDTSNGVLTYFSHSQIGGNVNGINHFGTESSTSSSSEVPTNPVTSGSTSKSSSQGVLIGAVIGGIFLAILIVSGSFLLWRSRRRSRSSQTHFSSTTSINSTKYAEVEPSDHENPTDTNPDQMRLPPPSSPWSGSDPSNNMAYVSPKSTESTALVADQVKSYHPMEPSVNVTPLTLDVLGWPGKPMKISQPLSKVLRKSVSDIAIITTSIAFLVYAFLAIAYDGVPKDHHIATGLLKASRFVGQLAITLRLIY